MIRRLANRHISPELILNAYYQGFFPMANERGEIGFYAFEKRGVVPIDDRFTVRKSLRQILRRRDYRVTFDTVPHDVLHACSRLGEVPSYELWLSDELIEQYTKLFGMGYVHTVEVWKVPSGTSGENEGRSPERETEESETGEGQTGETLIGGLYGLCFGAAFCGESMFSRAPYASQIALVHLVEHLRERGFELLDAQMPSEHLKQFGLYECEQSEYFTQFHIAAAKDIHF